MSFPFYHHIIDDFLDEDQVIKISQEFPEYNSNYWFYYNNPLENKKSCNNWYTFGPETYKTFAYLNSKEFISKLQEITGIEKLYPDIGLHGGGLHIHGKGGKLNVHLDYSIHPKLKLQRKLNLILYVTENWNIEWGGGLELWSHNTETNRPKDKAVTLDNIFNRAGVAAGSANLTFNGTNLTCGGTVTANSDENLKTNIKTIENALEKVCKLRGVQFNYKANGEYSLGFIAQEVEKIIPELVFGDDPKSVAYGNFVSLLVEAIKELKSEIDELKKNLHK